MQISAAAPQASQPHTRTTGPLSDHIRTQAAILAKDSKAGFEEKLKAFLAIRNVLKDDDYATATTQADRDLIISLETDSPFTKRVRAITDEASSKMMEFGRRGRAGQDIPDTPKIDVLETYSIEEQKMIMAGMAWYDKYDSLEALKAGFREQAQIRATWDDDETAKSSDPVTLSREADSILAQLENGSSPEYIAKKMLNPGLGAEDEAALNALKSLAENAAAYAEQGRTAKDDEPTPLETFIENFRNRYGDIK